MKVKKLVLIGLTMFAFSLSASGAVETYSDEYIFFEYDASAPGCIEKYMDPTMLEIYYKLQHTEREGDANAKISIVELKGTLGEYLNEDAKRYGQIGEITYSFDTKEWQGSYPDGSSIAWKILLSHNNQSAIARIFYKDDTSSDYERVKTFYDSIEISDNIQQNGYQYSDFDIVVLFEKAAYTSQIITYVQKALNTCDSYLDVEITASEAAVIFDELYAHTNAYMDYEPSAYDEEFLNLLKDKGNDFINYDYQAIIEMKTRLEGIWKER